MILTREEILKEVGFPNGLDAFQVNPHSIDLRISETVSMKKGDHILARTADIVKMPNDVMAIVYPRSSLNRMNVTLDVTGVVDSGYEGGLVLPLTSYVDITIKKGTRIASLIFYRLEQHAQVRLSKYHNSTGEFKSDKEEEMSLIETGRLDELAKRFPIEAQ